MMNKRTYLWIIGILVVLNLFSLSIIWIGQLNNHRPSEHPNMGDERMERRHSDFLHKELGLDEEQSKLVKEIRQKHRKQIRNTQKEIFKTKRLFIEESFAENSNDSLINQYANELGELQKELELINKEHIYKMKEHFNLKQTKKFKKLFREMIMKADPEARNMKKHNRKDRSRNNNPE